MNSITVTGRAAIGPQLRYTQDNQTPICEFQILIPGFKADAPPSQFPVEVWGDKAQKVQESVIAGQELVITGSIRINTTDLGTHKHTRAVIRASNVNSLQTIFNFTSQMQANAQSSPPPTAQPPAPNPAPVAPAAHPRPAPMVKPSDVEYDDIPF